MHGECQLIFLASLNNVYEFFVYEIPLKFIVSKIIVQCFYLLCNKIRTAVGFPVNMIFFLADSVSASH